MIDRLKKKKTLLRDLLKIEWGGYEENAAYAHFVPQFSELLLNC